MSEVIIKKCSGICGLELEMNSKNFTRNKFSKDGFRDQCKNCRGKGTPSKIIEENGKQYQICTGECKLKLEINEDNFYWRNDHNKFNTQCISCKILTTSTYYKGHREEIDIWRLNYNSKPEIKEKNKNRIKKKRKNPKNKIRHNISNLVLINLKRRNTKKSRSISKSLPYTIDELIVHLEIWFKKSGNEWMTLNNQGVYNPSTWDNNDKSTWVWHLDHIIADIKFNYTSEDDQEFKDCWALSNLRPLRADLNVSEGARRPRHKKK